MQRYCKFFYCASFFSTFFEKNAFCGFLVDFVLENRGYLYLLAWNLMAFRICSPRCFVCASGPARFVWVWCPLTGPRWVRMRRCRRIGRWRVFARRSSGWRRRCAISVLRMWLYRARHGWWVHDLEQQSLICISFLVATCRACEWIGCRMGDHLSACLAQ